MPPQPPQRLPKGRQIVGQERIALTKDFVARYGEGESIRAIARSTGRSYGFARRVLIAGGASLRTRGGPHRTSNTAS